MNRIDTRLDEFEKTHDENVAVQDKVIMALQTKVETIADFLRGEFDGKPKSKPISGTGRSSIFLLQ